MSIDFLFSIIVLIVSVMVHEVSHGYAAYAWGDPTAYYQGRLSFNPLKHLDLWGSIIIPILSFWLGGLLFGWAKPVPVNLYNVKNQKWGPPLIALAGPASNILIAVLAGLVLRFGLIYQILTPALVNILGIIVFINLVLAVFNLIPVPPLDGSKLFYAVIPERYREVRSWLERLSLPLILVLVLVIWPILSPVLGYLFNLITGLKLF